MIKNIKLTPARSVIVGIFVACVVTVKYFSDITAAKSHYATESHQQSQLIASNVENVFTQMYQGLRTMARLPGVQNISRHGENFKGDARTAVQEVYNNVDSNVSMSEIDIVPRNIDPDVIDPVTKKPAFPIATFDHLIVNRSSNNVDIADSTPEIELFEYRLEKKQEAWFSANVPMDKDIAGLRYPAICGPEVITCDNWHYSTTTPSDWDRRGLVYSVPFYRSDHTLGGSTTGVVNTHTIRDLLTDPDYVVRNANYNYSAVPNKPGIWQQSVKAYQQNRPNSSLIYSEVLPLNIEDVDGKWLLWCGRPNSDFWIRPDVRSSTQYAVAGYIAALLITWTMFGMIGAEAKNNAAIALKNAELQSQLRQVELTKVEQEATLENLVALVKQIQISSNRLQSASSELAGQSRQVGNSADEISANIREVALASEQSANAAAEVAAGAVTQADALSQGSELVKKLTLAISMVAKDAELAALATESANKVAIAGVASVADARAGMKRIEATVSKSATIIQSLGSASEQIGTIIQTIETIADQTSLLALNAAIEAARAGSAGRGFAVVADEVRKLSERSRYATQEITQLVVSIQDHTNEAVNAMTAGTTEVGAGMQLANDASAALAEIQNVVSQVTGQVIGICSAAEEMLASSSTVSESISEVAAIVEETSAAAAQMSGSAKLVSQSVNAVASTVTQQSGSVIELAASSDELASIANQLKDSVSKVGEVCDETKHDAPAPLRLAA